jgi:transposase-like protein
MKPLHTINHSSTGSDALAAVGETMGALKATGVCHSAEPPSVNGSVNIPDPEAPEKTKRGKFTAAYKLRILQEAQQCVQPGDIGALLRREALYSSHLTSWRRQREQGVLEGLNPKKRGRKAKPQDPSAGRIVQLEKENQRLKNRLRKAEIIIEAQKNLGDSGHRTESGRHRRRQMIQSATILSHDVGKKPACEALDLSRATFYRHLNPVKPKDRRPSPPLALSPSERQGIVDKLHSERFQDKAPLEVYATLLRWTLLVLCQDHVSHSGC